MSEIDSMKGELSTEKFTGRKLGRSAGYFADNDRPAPLAEKGEDSGNGCASNSIQDSVKRLSRKSHHSFRPILRLMGNQGNIHGSGKNRLFFLRSISSVNLELENKPQKTGQMTDSTTRPDNKPSLSGLGASPDDQSLVGCCPG
jgi:hypothetical protein